MTQEEKELVLKDLCARLPYSTLCYCKWTKDAPNGTSGCVQEVSTYLLEELMIIGDQNYECQICEIKPYLRPISSITEKEEREVNGLLSEVYDFTFRMDELLEFIQKQKEIPFHYIDWFNTHHFDYRGLIDKGLALEAPEDMYKIKELKKTEQEEEVELTDFESALFSAFSDAWQEYLSGKEVNVAKWTKEHSAELLEVARDWKPSDEQMEALLKLEEMHVLEHEKNQENAHLYMVIKSLREQLLKLKKGE